MYTVKIIKATRFELSDDPGHFYAGPERDDVMLEGVGCSVKDFLDCFMLTDEGSYFCILVNREGEAVGMSDIGGSRLTLEEGHCITVTFDAWLEAYLKFSTTMALREINTLYLAALSRLDI